MPNPKNRKNNSLIWIRETHHLNCKHFFQVFDQDTKLIFAIIAQQTVRTAHCLQSQSGRIAHGLGCCSIENLAQINAPEE